ncbi:MAG: DUF4214 domain-containing protein [Sediminimonas qiaohouensis]|uniref:DUF4214 domain-containing protein n=1 Tax=Sediminimonas qiaohouensis TaxID=552061 RepID=A0A7C9LQE8_9RHOB|nr:DUF4214 domain-containing protein [Sediminimonas qiaohouensis]MTJ06082.1 DUF4214 domain-containing protein [Sediminimonas qiaohouensis]
MAFADVESNTNVTGFSAADKTAILAAMKTAYEGSATAKTMFDDWISAGKTIDIDYKAGKFQAYSNTGDVEIDVAWLADNDYISPTGKAVEDTLVTGLVHELGHALTGKSDNNTKADYKGDNVTFVNKIYKELGLPEQISYTAYDSGSFLERDREYTNGTAIDVAVTRNSDISTHDNTPDNTKDLVIGGSSANKLQTGKGNDFLVGQGGNDELSGGDGTDTAVYLNDELEYDIRKNDDGTWTVKHVRGAKTEGEDTLKNIEKVQFGSDGETFDLAKKGLSFQTDFALVIDTTGSMGTSIGAVKAQATTLIDAAFAGGSADARIGVVGFKDKEIGEPTQVILPFTDQDSFADRKTAAEAAINGITVSGGGDLPETAFDGLKTALDGSMGDWRAGAAKLRVALFTDASAKDGHLASTVTSLANSIGAVITSRSSMEGTNGRRDNFELTLSEQSADQRDTEGNINDFVDEGDVPITETPTANVEIFTIFTGPDGVDTADLEAIARENGGSFSDADDDDALVAILEEIITAPPADVLEGTAGADRLVDDAGDANNNMDILGKGGDDTLIGRAGDDTLNGGKGDDILRGGEGNDIAEYSGSRDSYTVTFSDSGVSISDRRSDGDGTDTLINVETLSFSDTDWNLESFSDVIDLSAESLDSFMEMYIAYFDRAADSEGLLFWGTAFANGTTMEEMATLFIDQDETLAAYPAGTTNEEFANTVYGNVLGRTPDAAGLDFWVSQLDSGSVSRDQFILEVLRGVEDGTTDRSYLDDKVDLASYFSVIKGMSDVDNARAVMDAFGDQAGADLTAAKAAVDTAYSAAADADTGEFLLNLVGVIDDPFAVI